MDFETLMVDWYPESLRYDVRARFVTPEGRVERSGTGESLEQAVEATFKDVDCPGLPEIDYEAVASLSDRAIKEGWTWSAACWTGPWTVECNDAHSGKWFFGFNDERLEGGIGQAAEWVGYHAELIEERRKGYEVPGWLEYARSEVAERERMESLGMA